MINKVYVIPLALALVGLLGQHTFATNGSSYKYWLMYPYSTPKDWTHCTNVYCTNACKAPANSTGEWCPIAFPWSLGTYEWSDDPSFQYGFKTANTNYHEYFEPTDSGWDQPKGDDAIEICHDRTVTNATTCIHGYVQGFTQWCSTYTKDCAAAAIEGAIPLQVMSDRLPYDESLCHLDEHTKEYCAGFKAGFNASSIANWS
jgi:hypothetical protein